MNNTKTEILILISCERPFENNTRIGIQRYLNPNIIE